MTYKLAPSLMCCDHFHLGDQVKVMEQSGVDLLHIDIMDGSFVPNFALGTDFARQMKKGSRIPLDLHFMVENPERHIASFPMEEGDYVSIHFETTRHHQRVLAALKDRGAKTLLALNPSTPIEMASDLLDDLDGILIMTVNPGYAGQKMIPHAIEKIARTRRFLDERGREDAEIEVDGNVSIANAIRMRDAGANMFVAGSASVFGAGSLAENIAEFQKKVFH